MNIPGEHPLLMNNPPAQAHWRNAPTLAPGLAGPPRDGPAKHRHQSPVAGKQWEGGDTCPAAEIRHINKSG